MSTTIDEKVVEMRFDNKDFAEKTKDTVSLLDKLKSALKLDGATKGFENIDKAAKKTDISSVGKAVDEVKLKFSAMEVVAVTALTNITNKIVNMAQSLINDFTLAPVISGFQEYETQINAVQTILANTSSKGTTLEQVNAALDELNHYADLTIYNFTEMTRNIGTFTAAGIDLDTSVSAIQGIANLAAVSGSTSLQASTAMYQLSQALAAGTVKLQDWNSVVNAGMGGEVFQNALKETARIHGIAVDEMIEDEGSFRESLKKGWITADVLTETLSKFTKSGVNEYIAKNSKLSAEAIQKMREEAEAADEGATNYDKLAEAIAKKSDMSKDEIKQLIQMSDTAENAATKVKTFSQLMDTLKEAAQSGWTQTWEIIIGDFEEAKEFFTKISDFFSDAINKSANARNELLESALGEKYVSLQDWQAIINAGQASKEFIEVLKQTAREHGVAIDQMIEDEGHFNNTLKNRWLSLDILKDTFKKCTGELDSSTKNVNDSLEEFKELAKEVIRGNWGNGEYRKKALADAGHDYEAVQMIVNNMLLGWEIDMSKLSDAQAKSLGLTDEQTKKLRELAKQAEETGTPLNELLEKLERPTGRELLIDSMWNTIKAIVGPIQAVKAAWDDLFSISPDQLYNVIDGFHTFTSYLVLNDEQISKLTRTFKGLFSVLKIFTVFFGGAFGVGMKALRVILRNMDIDILDLTARIGDFLYKCSEWINTNNYLTKGLEYFARGVKMVLSLIRQWIRAFLEVPEVQKHINNLSEAFSKGLTKMKDYLREGKERVEAFTERLNKLDKVSLSTFMQTMKDFKDNVFDYFTNFDGLFDKIFSAFKNLRDRLANRDFDFSAIFSSLVEKGKEYSTKFSGYTNQVTTAFKWMKDNVVAALQAIQSVLGRFNWGAIGTILAGAGILYVAKSLYKVLSVFAKAFKGFGEIVDSATGVLDAFAGKLKAEALETKSKALRNVAISVAILAGSLIALSRVPTDDLLKAGVALGGLAIGLGALGAVIGIVNAFGAFTNASKALTGLAISVFILVKALKQMEKLDQNSLKGNAIVLGVLTGAFTLFAGMLGRFSPNLSKGGGTLLAMAISIRILVGALKTMQDLDMAKAAESVLVMTALIFALGEASSAASKVGKGSFTNVLAAALSLVVLTRAIKGIMGINVEEVTKHIGGFIVVFGMLAGLMLVGRLAGKNATKAGTGILAMALAVNLIAHAMKSIGKLSKGSINKSMGVIRQLFIVFGLLTALSKFSGKNAARAGVMILAMSGALLAISIVAYTMSKIPKEGLDQAIDAIVKMEACFAALIVVSKFAGEAGSVKSTIMTLVVAIAAMSIAVGALSMLDPSRLAGATAAISVLMGMFAVLAISTKYMGASKSTILIMTGVVAALAVILGILAQLPVQDVLGTAASLSMLMLSLSAMTVILAGVGKTGTSAIAGAGVMMAVIVEIAAFMAAAGLLVKYFPGLEELLDTGIPLLNKVADGIGQFLGNIVGGFLKGATDGLSEVADNLSEFMEHLQPFMNSVSKIDESATVGAKNIAETILILTAADIIKGLTSWLTGGSSLTSFASQLEPFGSAMAAYSDAVKGIDSEAVQNSAIAGKALAELAAELPNSGGVVGFFVGNNDMDVFAEQLPAFGDALSTYSNSVEGVKPDAVKNSAKAAKYLAEMAAEIPNSGGLISLFTGDNNLDRFAEQLPDFGAALANYSKSAEYVKPEVIKNSAEAAKALSELANNLPKSDGIFQAWFGGKSMDTFGTQLVSFGNSLSSYSLSLQYVTERSIEKSDYAAKSISNLIAALPETGGIFSAWFGGKINFTTFGADLVNFGQSMSDFTSATSGVNEGAVTAATNMAEIMTTLQDAVPDTETGLFSHSTTLADVGRSLVSFGREFSAFYDSISGIAANDIASVTAEMKHLVEMAKTMEGINSGAVSGFASALTNVGNSGIDGFLNAFKGAYSKAQTTGSEFIQRLVTGVKSRQSMVLQTFNQLVTAIMNALKAKANSFTSIGQNYSVKMANGIRSGAYRMTSAVGSAASRAASSARDYYSNFYNAGYHLATGFANGIDSGAYKAKTAARAMANAAANAARKALDEHSPSKVMYKIGDYAVQGFINALYNGVSEAYNSSEAVGDAAKNGIMSTLSAISSVLSGDLNVEPVIAPVVDMSNANAGIQAVNSLFDGTPNKRLGQITADINARLGSLRVKDINRSTSNAEIVSAITNLEDAMYNMQLVMDTGALVGSVGNRLDRQLGMKTLYKGRGN